jgi:exodeoxyribonuclease VII small subunit
MASRGEPRLDPAADRAAGTDFEASMQRLDQIVHELEAGQVPLERAMRLFEEGLQLGTACRKMLDEAQQRVERLLERVDGSATTEPFEPAP